MIMECATLYFSQIFVAAAYEKVAAKSRGQYSPLMIVRAVEAATKAKTFEEGREM